MDESEKAKMVGVAKFLRAFYYLSLVDKFGGIPLIIDAPNADEQWYARKGFVYRLAVNREEVSRMNGG